MFRHCVQVVRHGTILRAGDALNALGYFALCILRALCCEEIKQPWRISVSNSPDWDLGCSWSSPGGSGYFWGLHVTRDRPEARLGTKS